MSCLFVTAVSYILLSLINGSNMGRLLDSGLLILFYCNPAAVWGFLVWFYWDHRIVDYNLKKLIVPTLVHGTGYGCTIIFLIFYYLTRGPQYDLTLNDFRGIFTIGILGGVLAFSPISFLTMLIFRKLIQKVG